MRFSTRWLLAAVAYAALASAAIGTRSNRLADLVWAVSILAICYVGLFAFVARGKRQVMAFGFVALAVIHIVGLFVLPNRVPVVQVFDFIGYDVESTGYVSEPDRPVTGALRFFVTSGSIMPIVRTANAVCTLAAGLVGRVVAAVAYKHSNGEWPRIKWSSRFSLRTLLTVMTFVAIVLGIITAIR